MSNGDICSNNKIYGGFGTMIPNNLGRGEEERARRQEEESAASARCAVAAASTAPAPAKATVAPLRASGKKKSPPVTVAERTYLTKRPYKCQKKAVEPAAAPAPTAAPAPAPLVGFNGAAATVHAPAEKKPPTILCPVPAATSVPFLLDKPIHPCGILIEIVGTMMSCQGRSYKEHKICGDVLKEDVVVRLCKLQLMVEGKEETAIAAIWVTNGVDRCRIGFVPRHTMKHTVRYDGALAQVTRVLSDDAETCDLVERRLFHRNIASIISTLPGSKK